MKTSEYVRKSHNKQLIKNFQIGNIELFCVGNVDPNYIKNLLSKVPKRMLRKIDTVYYGENVSGEGKSGFYDSGCLYLNSVYNEQLQKTIFHELSHAFEQEVREQALQDKSLSREFLFKRNMLYTNLFDFGYNKINKETFQTLSYDKDFDEFLNSLDDNFFQNIFPTKYSSTSLNEYVAVGFELYFTKNKKELLNFPELYKFIKEFESLTKGVN